MLLYGVVKRHRKIWMAHNATIISSHISRELFQRLQNCANLSFRKLLILNVQVMQLKLNY